ncbi:MAG: pyridoxal phosphate-dependent aminotransferase [Actinobacteria bacterium]|nr:pyridoxal phosphate-dependent aminotransferase [Actinomycetota bacterium]MDA2976160.1 pyridoxal phosphate-dependent aminotransferase [Actinomycetota bacterium]NCV98388.1 pyridoxal phosphate-dependent aminotransferase [Actinomycetota bacterium]NDA13023.1 pyridoxal phosphate-dependent aminotransferase [Actinomycetota bacterium]
MSSSRISKKMLAIAESATLKVDSKAKALKAQGRPVISYAAGEPDFETPQNIVEAALRAVSDPKNHRYTPAVGLPEMREAIAEKTLRDSGTKVDPSQVLVTNGGKQAVYTAFQVALNDGDEVLVPTPYWTTYPEAIKLAGGTQVDVFAGSDQDYKVTPEQLEAHYTEKTKALLMCSPNNPTGAVYSKEELEAIGKWALGKEGLWVITDEIYQNLVYDGLKAYSITELVPELAERTMMVNGVAKSYAMTGWRLGWLIAPSDAAKAAANLQSHLTSNVSNISQRAAIEAITGDQEPVRQMLEAFDRRRKTAVAELNKIEGIVTPTPEGAFYVYPDVSGLFGRDFGGRSFSSSLELADFVLDEVEVALVPGEAFGPSGYFRLSYALGDDQLLEGIQRLQKLFS